MTVKEIRQAFLEFFRAKQHHIVPSAPIVIKNDPTLMFTNAGMNQFKNIFLGDAPATYQRVADTQRCLRVSGKHNDLDEVGIDTYHHTMFEMLGNWSFGDYFKEDAIAWSWQLLTEVYNIPPEDLYVTVFKGDKHDGLPKDDEALEIWKRFVAEDRIILGSKKDNFWEMGETGPCGPSSEIHVDSRSAEEKSSFPGRELVNQDHPQVIEIWNNVFIEYNRQKDGTLMPLPQKHVDTGMGLERLARVLQHKQSNYDTDVFQPLIGPIAAAAGVAYGTHLRHDVAMRVMADHVRAIAFAIADGQLPSNNKAGYVIRRILRRAVRYAYTFLGLKEPFLNTLVPVLARQFDEVFPELVQQQDFVQKVIAEEEAAFLRTLEKGIIRFENFISQDAKSRTEQQQQIPGEFAFELYDTFGFPVDLTELMAREKGWEIDMQGFDAELEKQKTRSRAATAVDTTDWVKVNDGDSTEFIGYRELETECKILRYRKVITKDKEQYQVVLNRTPFYAEGGGQTGDTGKLEDFSRLFEFEVTDTKKENGLIVHYLDMLPGEPEGSFWAMVNPERRQATEQNHTATHLLHAALKQVLGEHIAQKGSLVGPDYLRFDFSHFSKVSAAELAQVTEIVNKKIRENIPLKEEHDVPYQQALASGVTALFGEKYGDVVRVITFGDDFSKELCGGTHVQNTGRIGSFRIVSESAVSAGVRRIEAITGKKVAAFYDEQTTLINQVKELLKNPADPLRALHTLLDEHASQKKELEKLAAEKALNLTGELALKAEQLNGVNFIAAEVQLPNADAMKSLAFALKDKLNDLFVLLAASVDGKPALALLISENLVTEKGLHAGNIIRQLAKEIDGGGGGQPFFATAGGKNSSGIRKVLDEAKALVLQV